MEQGAFVLGVQINNVGSSIKELDALGEAAKRVAVEIRNLSKNSEFKMLGNVEAELAKLKEANQALINGNKAQQQQYKSLKKEHNETINKLDAMKKKYTGAGAAGVKSVKGTNDALKMHNDMMTGAIAKIVRYRIAFGIWQQVTQAIGDAVRYTIDLNQTMTNLQKVMNPITTDFEQLNAVAFNLGKRFGKSALEVAESMKVWAQQGKDMVEVSQLTKTTLSAVASANLSTQEAVEALTAATKGFNIAAEESTMLVDKWMAVQAKHAVSSQDLANATKVVAAAANTSGVNIDQLNGVIAAIGSVTRKTGREVANSFKTMLARINRPATIKTFQDVGVAVMASANEMRAVPSILSQLNEKWDGLTKAQQNNIALTVGGIRRYADFLVLMQNFDEYQKATTHSATAFGEAALATQIQLESYQSRIQMIKTGFEEFGYAIMNSGVVTTMIEWASSLGALVNKISNFLSPMKDFILMIGNAAAKIAIASAAVYILRKATVLLAGGFKHLTLSAVTATGGFIRLATAFTAATTTARKATIAMAGLRASLGGIASIALGIAALIPMWYDFSKAVDTATTNFGELQGEMEANTLKTKKHKEALEENLVVLNKLIAARDNYLKGDVDNKALNEEQAISKLNKTYPSLIQKFNEFITVNKDGVATFEATSGKMATVQKKLKDKIERITSVMVKNATADLKTMEQQYTSTAKSIENFSDIMRNVEIDPSSLLVTVTEFKGVSSLKDIDVSVVAQTIRDSLLNSIDKSGLEAEVKKTLTDKIKDALEGVGDAAGKGVDSSEFKAAMDAFDKVAYSALAKMLGVSEDTVRSMNNLKKVLYETGKSSKNAGDSLYYTLPAATQLAEKMNTITKEADMSRKNLSLISKVYTIMGRGINTIEKEFQINTAAINKLMELKVKHEAKIYKAEQKLLDLQNKASSILDTDLKDQQEKLTNLKEQKGFVSGIYEEYKKLFADEVSAHNKKVENLNKESKLSSGSLEERKELRKELQHENKQHDANLKKLYDKYSALLKNKGEYGKIVTEILRLAIASSNITDDLIVQNSQIAEQKRRITEIGNVYSNMSSLAKARGVGEADILRLQLQGVDAKIRELNEQKAVIGSTKDLVKKTEEINKLYDERLALQNKLNLTAPLTAIEKARNRIVEQADRESVIQELINKQYAMNADNSIDALLAEKESIKALAEKEDALRKQNGFYLDEIEAQTKSIAVRKKLLDVDKKIVEAALERVEAYRSALSATSTNLGSALSSGIGGWYSKQKEVYGELQTLAQDFADAERARQEAIMAGDAEALYDAEASLRSLKERQDELTSSTYLWKQALTEVLDEISSLVNEKLSEQFVDNLMNINLKDVKVGEQLAKGLVIQPDEARFKFTSDMLNNSLNSSFEYGADVLSAAIMSSLDVSAAQVAQQKGVSEAVSVVSSSGVQAAIDESNIANQLVSSFTTGSNIMSNSIVDAGSLAGVMFVAATKRNMAKSADNMKKQLEIGADTTKSKLSTAFESGTRLLGNVIGSMVGGGGQYAQIGSSIGGMLPGILGAAGPMGALLGLGTSILGGILGGSQDRDSDVDTKPFFDRALPVEVENFDVRETFLHDLSISVELNTLDPSQVDPIIMRNLAEHINNETTEMLKKQGIID